MKSLYFIFDFAKRFGTISFAFAINGQVGLNKVHFFKDLLRHMSKNLNHYRLSRCSLQLLVSYLLLCLCDQGMEFFESRNFLNFELIDYSNLPFLDKRDLKTLQLYLLLILMFYIHLSIIFKLKVLIY